MEEAVEGSSGRADLAGSRDVVKSVAAGALSIAYDCIDSTGQAILRGWVVNGSSWTHRANPRDQDIALTAAAS